jgi:hypothetical protein
VPKKDFEAGFELPPLPEKKRTPIHETRADRFIAGSTRTSRHRSQRSSRLRRDEIGDCERLNVYIPADLAMRVKERALRERRSVSDAVTAALEHWVGRSGTKAQ